MGKRKVWIKRVGTLCLSAVVIAQLGLEAIAYADNNSSSILGTNSALGSAILDNSFVAEDWNKWEMLTWGVFLSNFPVPLVDDYESAFNSNSTTGSKGASYKALSFGSGSDNANAETIKNMLNYAVNQQKTGGLKEIYVNFSPITRDKVDIKPVSDTSSLRGANFKDMFLADSSKNGDSWVQLGNVTGVNNPTNVRVPISSNSIHEGVGELGKEDKYVSLSTINSGSLPTFYVKYGSSYEKIFDYADGWDAQIMTAWIARVASGEYGDDFKDIFNSLWSENTKLYLDCFGNMVVNYASSRRVLIPASINQHLTNTPKINLVSSLIFNGYNSNTSGTDLAIDGRQSVSGWFGWDFNADVRFGGVPAFGNSVSGLENGLITFYYDTDTIAYQNYFKGGSVANGTKTVVDEPTGKVKYNLHYGKALEQLFNLDINNSASNSYLFKIEPANMDKFNFSLSDKNANQALKNMLMASGEIANIVGSVNAKVLSTIKTTTGEESLFSSPVLIPVQSEAGRTKNSLNGTGVSRLFLNYIYETYNNKKTTTAGDIDKSYVETVLGMESSSSMSGLRDNLLGLKNEKVSTLLASFIADKNELFRLQVGADSLLRADIKNDNIFKNIDKLKVDGKSAVEPLYDTSNTSLNYFPGRVVKAYPVSEVMRSVGNILGVKEGTEFSQYSTFIYMTYLDWYGVRNNKYTSEVSSEFNTKIFDGTEDVLKVDISDIANIKSEEDKKAEVLNYTYMLLNPTEGKEYRNKMMTDYVSNFMYDTYNKIVYGNSTTVGTSVDGISTRNATGFLNIDNYTENFTTGWLMKIYSKLAVVFIGIAFIAIIVFGLLKGRGKSWYIVAFVVVTNTILLVPTLGDIAPMVINNYVQSMFKDKMTYWGISESVTNANIESKYSTGNLISTGYLSYLSADEKARVADLVKTLNVTYLDRALMVKSDISRKVTQTDSGNYAEIQSLRSARWLLPMIMRQFTSDKSTADYVYLPLGDMYDDLSNLYWMYKPSDATTSQTIAGTQSTVSNGSNTSVAKVEKPIVLADRKNYFIDYKDTTIETSKNTVPYRSQAYYNGNTLDDLPHTYFYLLKTNANPISRSVGFGGAYVGDKSYANYIKVSLSSGKAQSFLSTANSIEQVGGKYVRTDRSSMRQSYGYLWATENPYHYFYEAVKDSFNNGITLGALIGKLQGQYTKLEDGTEVRTSFMHAGETGYVRDVLDLQEMFTNMLPYLYQMQLTAGGFDGTSGVLGSAYIDKYSIYENNYKSWLFRSNWATKIMESPELTKKATVRKADGTKVTILNPTLIDCYPADRPMVFSEAQMNSLGLSEADLNLVELKCVEVNKQVSRRWTTLLNYANVKGITKEVLVRQMATESILEFNDEFSSSSIFNNNYKLYPTGLDLRAISFDSVMKMLMLNVTRDTSYIYGDTMQNVVSNSDIISSALLLIAAFISSYIVPFIRTILMGALFYLGIWAMLYSLISDSRAKARVSCGYIVSNLVFIIITILYYWSFSVLMAVTTSDSVLTVQSVQVNTGNPVWCFIVIIIVSIVYVIALIKMINICFKNFRDMGLSVYTEVVSNVVNTVSDSITKGSKSIRGLMPNSGMSGENNNSGRMSKDEDNDFDYSEDDINNEIDNASQINIDEFDYGKANPEEINSEIEKASNTINKE